LAYASKAGRARVSSRNPQAQAVCDRCGIWTNHTRLQWQYDWRGASLANIRILVCDECLDEPQQQLRAIVVPADPVPITQPRTEPYFNDEVDYRITQGNTIDPVTGIPVIGGATRITQNNNYRVTQQTGEAPSGLNQLPGTDWNAPAVIYNNTEIGLPYDNTSVPFTGPLSPPYNFIVQWNNQWFFGIRTGSYWTNNVGAFVNWSTTIL